VTESEFSLSPWKVKAYFLDEKIKSNILEHKLLFKTKYLSTFVKNKILLLVIYGENKPRF
jgi:hypothetical protein